MFEKTIRKMVELLANYILYEDSHEFRADVREEQDAEDRERFWTEVLKRDRLGIRLLKAERQLSVLAYYPLSLFML